MRSFRVYLNIAPRTPSPIPMLLGGGSSLVVPRRGPCAVQDAGEGRANLTNTMEYDAAGQLANTTAPDGRVSGFFSRNSLWRHAASPAAMA